MSWVIACYVSVFGVITAYAARLVLKSRVIAAQLLSRDAAEGPSEL